MTCQRKKKKKHFLKLAVFQSSQEDWMNTKNTKKKRVVMKMYSCSCGVEEMFVSSVPGAKKERQRKQVVIIQC